MAAPSFATARRSVKSVGTFSVVPMPHVACIAGSRVPIQLHVIRSTFLIDNLDPMSRMVVSRIGGALPKAAGFIGGRAGPLTDVSGTVLMAGLIPSSWKPRLIRYARRIAPIEWSFS